MPTRLHRTLFNEVISIDNRIRNILDILFQNVLREVF